MVIPGNDYDRKPRPSPQAQHARSERKLDAVHQNVLTVQRNHCRRCHSESCVLVVGFEFDVAVQVPVQAEGRFRRPQARYARRGQLVDEGLVAHVEPRNPTENLPRARFGARAMG